MEVAMLCAVCAADETSEAAMFVFWIDGAIREGRHWSHSRAGRVLYYYCRLHKHFGVTGYQLNYTRVWILFDWQKDDSDHGKRRVVHFIQTPPGHLF
jgi:hypothetical protein